MNPTKFLASFEIKPAATSVSNSSIEQAPINDAKEPGTAAGTAGGRETEFNQSEAYPNRDASLLTATRQIRAWGINE